MRWPGRAKRMSKASEQPTPSLTHLRAVREGEHEFSAATAWPFALHIMPSCLALVTPCCRRESMASEAGPVCSHCHRAATYPQTVPSDTWHELASLGIFWHQAPAVLEEVLGHYLDPLEAVLVASDLMEELGQIRQMLEPVDSEADPV